MANEASTSESSGGESDVHRLRDILVEEVSLVDRAANKRRFLVVKRNGDASDDGPRGRPRKADAGPGAAPARGRGKKKPGPDPKVDKARRSDARATSDKDEDMEKARRSKPPWEKDDDETTKADDEADDEDEDEDETTKADDEEEDDDEDVDKADDEDEEADDAKTNKADDEDDEDDDDDAKTNKADDEDDEDDDAPAGKARTRARPTGGAAATRVDPRAKPTEKAAGDDDVVMPAAVKTALLRVLTQALERLMGVANRIKEADEPDDETEVNVPDDLEEDLEDIGELLEDVAERLPTSKAAPGTTGVAKAGRRMAKDRLDRFQKALELLSDVLKELTDAKGPPEPTAGGAERSRRKRAGTPGVQDVLASMGELTELMKRQQDELVTLRKTRAVSNALSVDGGRRRETQDVSWPLDMNRPISRETVGKTTSFYNDEP